MEEVKIAQLVRHTLLRLFFCWPSPASKHRCPRARTPLARPPCGEREAAACGARGRVVIPPDFSDTSAFLTFSRRVVEVPLLLLGLPVQRDALQVRYALVLDAHVRPVLSAVDQGQVAR